MLRQTSIALLCAFALFGLTGAVTAQNGVTLVGVALDTADENRFFMRTGGTVRNDLSYSGLDTGVTYTVAAQLFNMTTEAASGDLATKTFTPEASTGSLSIELPVPQNRTEFNIDYVVLVSLYRGELDNASVDNAEALIKLDDVTDINQTIQSHAIQSVSVTATAEDGHALPPKGGVIEATVSYANLVAGYPYTIWGQLLTPSGQATGIYASVPEYIPSDKNGAVKMEFTVPEGFDGIKLIPTVGLYHKKRVELNEDGSLSWIREAPVPVMIASDLSLDAPEQTISIGTPFEDLPINN